MYKFNCLVLQTLDINKYKSEPIGYNIKQNLVIYTRYGIKQKHYAENQNAVESVMCMAFLSYYLF